VRVSPLGSPVLNFDYTNAWRTNCDDVDLIGLEPLCDGKSNIRQKNPFIVTQRTLQPIF
jgi:hypothetical protein